MGLASTCFLDVSNFDLKKSPTSSIHPSIMLIITATLVVAAKRVLFEWPPTAHNPMQSVYVDTVASSMTPLVKVGTHLFTWGSSDIRIPIRPVVFFFFLIFDI